MVSHNNAPIINPGNFIDIQLQQSKLNFPRSCILSFGEILLFWLYWIEEAIFTLYNLTHQIKK
jgi:hypothetical protein